MRMDEQGVHDVAREAELVARSAFAATRQEWNTLLHTANVVRLLGTDATDYEQAAGWLHDVIEDTDLTFDDLEDMRFPAEVIQAVRWLTRGGESYHEYKNDLIGAPGRPGQIARKVKLADARHNFARCQQAGAIPKWQKLGETRYGPLIAQLAAIVPNEQEEAA